MRAALLLSLAASAVCAPLPAIAVSPKPHNLGWSADGHEITALVAQAVRTLSWTVHAHTYVPTNTISCVFPPAAPHAFTRVCHRVQMVFSCRLFTITGVLFPRHELYMSHPCIICFGARTPAWGMRIEGNEPMARHCPRRPSGICALGSLPRHDSGMYHSLLFLFFGVPELAGTGSGYRANGASVPFRRNFSVRCTAKPLRASTNFPLDTIAHVFLLPAALHPSTRVRHRVQMVVARLPQFLSTTTASQVSSILSPDTMEYVSTWADKVKEESGWSWSKVRRFAHSFERVSSHFRL